MCRPVGVDGEERDSPRLSPGTETNKDRISVPFRSQRRGPDVMVGEGCVVLIHLSLSLMIRAMHPLWPLAPVSRVILQPPGEASPPGRGPYGPEWCGKSK